MALDSAGRIWGWGNNEYNQISADQVDRIGTPQEIVLGGGGGGFLKSDAFVTKIAATSTQGFALVQSGEEKCKFFVHKIFIYKFKILTKSACSLRNKFDRKIVCICI